MSEWTILTEDESTWPSTGDYVWVSTSGEVRFAAVAVDRGDVHFYNTDSEREYEFVDAWMPAPTPPRPIHI